MVIDPILIIVVLALALGFFFLGLVFKTSKKKHLIKKDDLNSKSIINRFNNSQAIQDFGGKFTNNKELEILFRKSKNPWNLTPATYNFIRFGLGGASMILAIASYLIIDWTFALVFAAAGSLFFFLPKKKYTDIASHRENQWNQLYQFIWVIKHNLNYYDPKKTWINTENYIKDHAPNLDELQEGFHDFSIHWNGNNMDEYINKNYGDFPIPKQLYEVVLNAQLTGEYPNEELNSLRKIILEKMNFHVQEVLQMVGAKATMASAPFLLCSVSLVILVPVMLSIFESFA